MPDSALIEETRDTWCLATTDGHVLGTLEVNKGSYTAEEILEAFDEPEDTDLHVYLLTHSEHMEHIDEIKRAGTGAPRQDPKHVEGRRFIHCKRENCEAFKARVETNTWDVAPVVVYEKINRPLHRP